MKYATEDEMKRFEYLELKKTNSYFGGELLTPEELEEHNEIRERCTLQNAEDIGYFNQ